MDETGPLNRAHSFAGQAEDYRDSGKWAKAADYHSKAAEQFLLATQQTTNAEVLKTLHLLQASHSQQAKELQKKVSAQSHRPPQYATPSYQSTSSSPRQSVSQVSDKQSQLLQRQQQQQQRQTPYYQPQQQQHYQQHILSTNTSPSSSTISTTTAGPTEASYLFLTHPKDLEAEVQDPFNRFWDAVENLVQKTVTAPVAFATAPLGFDEFGANNSGGNKQSNNTSPSSSYTSNNGSGGGRDVMSETIKGPGGGATSILNSYFVVPSSTSAPEYYPSATYPPSSQQQQQSVPSSSRSSHPNYNGHQQNYNNEEPLRLRTEQDLRVLKTSEELRLENASLKMTVDMLSRQVVALQRAAEENDMLRSSIIQFRQDVQKEKAKQRMLKPTPGGFPSSPAASTMMDEREASLTRKVVSLQDELKLAKQDVERVKQENERHVSALHKYRERWERLKESAKKRKELSPTTGEGSGSNGSTPQPAAASHGLGDGHRIGSSAGSSGGNASSGQPASSSTTPTNSNHHNNTQQHQQPAPNNNSSNNHMMAPPVSIGTVSTRIGMPNTLPRTTQHSGSPPSSFPAASTKLGTTRNPFEHQRRTSLVNDLSMNNLIAAGGASVTPSVSPSHNTVSPIAGNSGNSRQQQDTSASIVSSVSSKRDVMGQSNVLFYSTTSGFE
ncbi:hypothetical protein SmJEL517_g03267 [Synchytrium microbalum]|uniref:MIT domain-containing protein n=1 Tax=Synchytrium microbalum TaxID=1806994 RepID=A0A507C3Q2_9FUNG|nr:uncharacterized protein SmJEL517_g03267 [Synchytrium microbalum]TPX34018.1 hypothetical protein SmJEL517_g03267 [Synchytrium microbalum]